MILENFEIDRVEREIELLKMHSGSLFQIFLPNLFAKHNTIFLQVYYISKSNTIFGNIILLLRIYTNFLHNMILYFCMYTVFVNIMLSRPILDHLMSRGAGLPQVGVWRSFSRFAPWLFHKTRDKKDGVIASSPWWWRFLFEAKIMITSCQINQCTNNKNTMRRTSLEQTMTFFSDG